MPPLAAADAPRALHADRNAPPSSSAAEAVNARRHPPPESKQSLWLRRFVILSFWTVVIFLGLPVWWKTTAIYRAELPLQDMMDWADGKVVTSN